MSVFRDAVKDYLNEEPSSSIPAEPKVASKSTKTKSSKGRRSDEIIVEKFSGLRIRCILFSSYFHFYSLVHENFVSMVLKV
jgi:hypothetical protein